MAKKSELEAIKEVLASRKLPSAFNLKEICFPEQLAFIEDPADWVTASCSRRAGKTEVCALDLISTAIQNPSVTCLYITLTRANAERIVWAKLLEINYKYELGGDVSLVKLSITFPNKSIIYLSGCSDKSELDKFRGLALKLVYLDEIQSFKSFVQELVDDVLGPALADHAGKLKLIGTPAPVNGGFFKKALDNSAYSHHHWTFWNNPFIAKKAKKTHQQILDRELKRRGVSVSDASVRREWFGEWAKDLKSLVFAYNSEINKYEELPELTDYVIGVDLGSNVAGRDKDAIAVIGWHKNHKKAYLVEEFIGAEEGITPLTDKLARLIITYSPLKVVMDTGALGRKIADELRKRHNLPIVAAEKTRKLEYIEFFNDALRTGNFMARTDSKFADDSQLIVWDYDKSTADKMVIKSEPHSDIADAVLYAWKEALQWLSEASEAPINIKDRGAWLKYTEKLMLENLQKQIDAEQAQEQESDQIAMMDMGYDENPLHYYLNKRNR